MSKAPPEIIAKRQRQKNLSRDIRDMAARLEREVQKLIKAADAIDLEIDETERTYSLGIYAVPTPMDHNDVPIDEPGVVYQCRS